MTETTPPKASKRKVILAVAIAGLIGVMALDTKVVPIGSDQDIRQQAFNPDRFGQNEFPRIRDLVVKRAPNAPTLAAALTTDKAAAIADYGTMAGGFAVFAVQLTGVVGTGTSGIFNVAVDGVPKAIKIRIQTGPAINGTELRDVSGDIGFGAFKNQIEYQDAGAGINRAMAADQLSDLDRDALSGKTVTVTGAFTLINPKNWLITPVAFEVAQ
jgi:predicted lipoprotein